jgi:hypothetical protein
MFEIIVILWRNVENENKTTNNDVCHEIEMSYRLPSDK